MDNKDVQFGQLALARGAFSVPQLIRCVEKAADRKVNLSDVLIAEGIVSNQEAEEILADLKGSEEGLLAEFELGKRWCWNPFKHRWKFQK